MLLVACPRALVSLRAQSRPDTTARPPAADSAAQARKAAVLPTVRVRATRRRTPSLHADVDGEGTTRLDTPFQLLDPLTQGSLGAMLGASPDFVATMRGGFSLLGGPAESNQLSLGGIRVPSGMVTGAERPSLITSPWDVATGGAAGASAELRLGPGSGFASSWMIVRSGASGIVGGDRSAASGVTAPLQFTLGSSGTLGRWQYNVSTFASRAAVNLRRWDTSLAPATRQVLDSLARLTNVALIQSRDVSQQYGVLTRIDLPTSDTARDRRRYDAVTVGLTRTAADGGMRGEFSTASHAVRRIVDVGALQFESVRIVAGTARLATTAAVSQVTGTTARASGAPSVTFSDSSIGATVAAGGAPPEAGTRTIAAEARSQATWFSADNGRRYLGQLQARLEEMRVTSIAPSASFTSASARELQAGQALTLTRTSGAPASSATSLVVSPAASVAFDVGKRGTMLLGARADAWQARDVLKGQMLRGFDLQPRVSLQRQLGRRSRQRGTFATLRGGAGRFVDWPSLEQWSPAWSGGGAAAVTCTGASVPAIRIAEPAQSCTGVSDAVTLDRLEAARTLRPVASTRGELTLSVHQIVPKVRAEFGISAARYARVAVIRSPYFGRAIAGTLAGESGRAVLVPTGTIGRNGVVPLAPLTGTYSAAPVLAPDGRRTGVQYRVRLATRDPWEPLQLEANYTWNGGRQTGVSIAPSFGAPGLLTTIASGNRHTLMVSAARWIGVTQFRVNLIARSGLRFTPLADRDLNGDGAANDAAYVPAGQAAEWASDLPSSVRGCVRGAAGRIFRPNECAGPWSISSNAQFTMPGTYVGLPLGTEVTLQLSNPTALLAGLSDGSRVTFGSSPFVDPRLARITGYDDATQRFVSSPLSGFGRAAGLSRTVTDPFQVAISVRLQLGRRALDKRMDASVRLLATDTTQGTRTKAAEQVFAMLPNIPEIFLEYVKGLDLTKEQRDAMLALQNEWAAIPLRTVARIAPRSPTDSAARRELVAARARALDEVMHLVMRLRTVLTPEQLAALEPNAAMMLNLRVFRWAEKSAYPF
jgi:hypothetical protein